MQHSTPSTLAFSAGEESVLRERATRDVVRRSSTGTWFYLLVSMVICGSTSLLHTRPGFCTVFVLAFLVLAVHRLWCLRHLAPRSAGRPGAWERHAGFNFLVNGSLWGIFAGQLLAGEPLSWPSLLALITTLGIVGGGLTALIPRLLWLRAYLTLVLTPTLAGTLLGGGSSAPVLALLLALYGVYMFRQGGELNREYWAALRNTLLLERQAEELRRARWSAEEAGRLRDEFLANVSHELRTPLNGIVGMLDLARHECGPEALGDYFEPVESSAEHLREIIDSILSFSNQTPLREECFPLRTSLRELLAGFQDRAAARGLDFVSSVAEHLPEGIRGDEGAIRQVLACVLGNAIKFTAAGQVRVSFEGRSLGNGRWDLLCLVEDSGCGIAPEDRETIFEPFRQLDGSSTRRHDGMGMGLALARELARRMGGDIGVESTQGVGSRFEIRLSVEEIPEPVTPV